MEIDNALIKNEEIQEKTKLEDFVKKYAKLNNVFFDKGKIIPFNLVDVYGTKYLFLADENDDITDLTTILTNINFDFTKLQSASDIDIIQKFGQVDLAQYFYVNGKTYIVQI